MDTIRKVGVRGGKTLTGGPKMGSLLTRTLACGVLVPVNCNGCTDSNRIRPFPPVVRSVFESGLFRPPDAAGGRLPRRIVVTNLMAPPLPGVVLSTGLIDSNPFPPLALIATVLPEPKSIVP